MTFAALSAVSSLGMHMGGAGGVWRVCARVAARPRSVQTSSTSLQSCIHRCADISSVFIGRPAANYFPWTSLLAWSPQTTHLHGTCQQDSTRSLGQPCMSLQQVSSGGVDSVLASNYQVVGVALSNRRFPQRTRHDSRRTSTTFWLNQYISETFRPIDPDLTWLHY